ncbi:hypothetical protein JI58_02455 [Marinosulfonomonas sp. PRT-SC04]|nr:hypothetical protein JI58_02455 [Marinosulfonomonas sp. PRT-SC04]
MLKKIIHISKVDSGSIAFDWVVLSAGIVSLGMALTLTATHNANAASPQESSPVVVAQAPHVTPVD